MIFLPFHHIFPCFSGFPGGDFSGYFLGAFFGFFLPFYHIFPTRFHEKCPHPQCYSLFQNGKCDEECNIEECLWDGWFDCRGGMELITPELDSECNNLYNNGVCNEKCNNSAAGFDGDDCLIGETKFDSYSKDVLEMEVANFDAENKGKNNKLARSLTATMGVRFKIMTETEYQNFVEKEKKKSGSEDNWSKRAVSRSKRAASSKIHARIDSGQWSAKSMANFFTTSTSHGQKQDLNINGFQLSGFGSQAVAKPEVSSSQWWAGMVPRLVVGGLLVSFLVLISIATIIKVRQKFIFVPSGGYVQGQQHVIKTGSKRKFENSKNTQNSQNGQNFETANLKKGHFDSGTHHFDCQAGKMVHYDTFGTASTQSTLNGPSSSHNSPPPDEKMEIPDNNGTGPEGRTPLHVALSSTNCNPEMIRMLIKDDRYHANQVTDQGETALHIAARYKHIQKEIIDILLNEGHARPDIRNYNGETVMHVAVASDNFDMFQCLLQSKYGIECMKDKTRPEYKSVIMLLVIHNVCLRRYIDVIKIHAQQVLSYQKMFAQQNPGSCEETSSEDSKVQTASDIWEEIITLQDRTNRNVLHWAAFTNNYSEFGYKFR